MRHVPQVERGVIDIWSWSLDRSIPEVARLWDTLSVDETMRAAGFVRERDAIRFSTGRGVMRTILGSYLNVSASALALRTHSNGKPEICPSMGSSLRFNLSHSADRAVLAVCDMLAIGIDIEEIRPIEEDVASHFFSKRECGALKALPSESYMEGFYRCWTRKEAFVKAHGAGLLLPLDSFDVTVAAGAVPRLERLEGDDRASERWTLLNIQVPPGFAGAIAVMANGEPTRLRYRHLAAILGQHLSLVT